MKCLVAVFTVLCLLISSNPLPALANPPELGAVVWLRELDDACAQARDTGRPILALFQEIPGCQTCQDFGAAPLSHPLLVEAIEDLFVPLAIHNNKPGQDAEVLEQFKEPAWNNPVIRYLDADKTDIIPREDRVWTIGGTARRMIEALEQAERPVPTYLQLVAAEHSGDRKTALLSMHCYWEGEGQLGGLAGVVNTNSGWLRGQEVVRVAFDPAVLTFADLLTAAKTVHCADGIFATSAAQQQAAEGLGFSVAELAPGERVRPAKATDQRYYLRQTAWRHLPLTPLQATRMNAALRKKQDPRAFLSPRQQELWQQVTASVSDQPRALAEFTYPDDVRQLPGYAQRLRKKLGTGTSSAPQPPGH